MLLSLFYPVSKIFFVIAYFSRRRRGRSILSYFCRRGRSILSYFGLRKIDKRRRRTQKTRKIDTELLLFIQKYQSLYWLGILTQSVNLVSGVSHTARYKIPAIKLANRIVFSVVVLIPFDPKQRAPCWVFTTELLRIWIRFWRKQETEDKRGEPRENFCNGPYRR